ncbi:MAG: sugar phosphate isomerase/epimerase [Verrucomicrobiota bacterium]
MKPGLVSVTFRQLSPESIVDLCVKSGLQTVEWGGDVHVPPGDAGVAFRVGEMTREAGLSITAYGSYYRLAVSGGATFEEVLCSAVALDAPAIRVWAGNRGSADADEACRKSVADDALRCADLAAEKGISICYEFHDGTLTDTTESAMALLAETDHPFIRSLWQPPHGKSLEECLASLRSIMPRLHHVHAFHWWPDPGHRQALADGRERWEAYVAEMKAASKDANLLLEFVRGDDPLLLEEDARTLRDIIAESHCE